MRVLIVTILTLLLTSCALADTVQQLYAQAQKPWQETIFAFGREISIDVTPQMPDVDALCVYRVQTVSAQESLGDSPRREQPRKQRGYATRTKPQIVVPFGEIDRDFCAYGSSVTAGEAADRITAFLAPVREKMERVELEITQMHVRSPIFRFNKETGEWENQVYEDAVGQYSFDVRFTLDGIEVPQGGGNWRDVRKTTFGVPEPELPYWSSALIIGENGAFEMKRIEAPSVSEVIVHGIELATLEKTKASLRALAQDGLLRSIRGMKLIYAAFDTGEGGEEWELRPVWATEAEIYFDETRSAEYYGEPWYQNVYTDARTGEIIELRWADGVQQQNEPEQ